MDILVIGGTRMMGTHLVLELLRNKHSVTILTRGRADDAFGDTVGRITADRQDKDSLKAALAGRRFDAVCDNICYSSLDVRALMDAVKPERYVMISTCSVYDTLAADTREEAFDPLARELVWAAYERTPEGYGIAKRQAETAIFKAYPDIPSAAIRPAYVVGRDDYTRRLYFYADHVVNQKPMNINNMDSRISFTDSAEAGRLLAFLAENDFRGVLNAASPGGMSPRDIIAYTEEKTGLRAILAEDAEDAPYNHNPDFTMNTDKAAALGFPFSPLGGWIYSLLDYCIGEARQNRA